MHFKSLYFDLDDTLYPASSGLWAAIRERMNAYMQRLIDLPIPDIVCLRQSYLEKYGTTLRGLQAHYKVDADEYLAFVHDLPLEKFIHPDPSLRTLLLSLPQRRWVFTNADTNHANHVLNILGITDCFEGIIDIRGIDFACKPEKIAYQRALALAGDDDPSHCVIFDDALRNLSPAREMGFYTILVGKDGTEPLVDQAITSLHELRDCLPELWEKDN
ncbi:MAG: pyrimidine 5'-nucleotidase [Anaerolineales bacterium]|jgi:pyrimidine 5'-nucleotidase